MTVKTITDLQLAELVIQAINDSKPKNIRRYQVLTQSLIRAVAQYQPIEITKETLPETNIPTWTIRFQTAAKTEIKNPNQIQPANIGNKAEIHNLLTALIHSWPNSDRMVGNIIENLITTNQNILERTYYLFLDAIAEAIGRYNHVLDLSLSPPDEKIPRWHVSFRATAQTPNDGGPFATLNPEVKLDNWLNDRDDWPPQDLED